MVREVAGLQGCRVTRLQGYKVAGLQGCRVVVKFGLVHGKHSFSVGLIESPTLIKMNALIRHFDEVLICRY